MTADKFDFALVRVKFKEIRPDNLNPRHQREPEADQTLKRLIDTHGTIDMMWICKNPDGHFRLLDGHRRYDIRVEDEYLERNPTVTCVILLAKDDPDRVLTDEEITLWRILRERGKEKWKDFDFYLKAVEHADSQKEQGRKYFQIAREDFNWNPTRLSHIKAVLEDPVLSDFLSHGTISMHEAVNLLNIPAETQKDLIERRDTLSAKELRETVKLVREGVETASAIESVKESKEDIPDDDPRTALINTVPEDLRERFTNDTKDFNLHDIERIVKLIENGVVMHDAIRTVKLSETSQGTEEDALTVNDGGGGKEEAPSSPETTGIVAQTLGIEEKGTEDEPPEEDEEPEEGAEEEEPKEGTTKDKHKAVSLIYSKPIKFVHRMLTLSQATESHMKETELEALDDSRYRKLLKDYEEASFAIDGFRDFLHGRENDGSVQFNRAKRLHTAIRDFDPHTISSVKEATDLRSIKIQTKKKLTDDVNILDTIANAKRTP